MEEAVVPVSANMVCNRSRCTATADGRSMHARRHTALDTTPKDDPCPASTHAGFVMSCQAYLEAPAAADCKHTATSRQRGCRQAARAANRDSTRTEHGNTRQRTRARDTNMAAQVAERGCKIAKCATVLRTARWAELVCGAVHRSPGGYVVTTRGSAAR
jgi:hypothetical protein